MLHKFIRINTILIPQDDIQDQLVKLAKKITRGKKELFRIDNKNFFAHITLYSPEYPTCNLEKVTSKVKEISENKSKIVLEFDDFYTGWGFVGLGFKKNAWVDNLQKVILKELNPLREERIREKYDSEIIEGKYSKEEVNYIMKYGYNNVLNSFHPHLTLARFGSEDVAQGVKNNIKKNILPSKIAFPYLAISEMRPNGTCTKVLKKFKLYKFHTRRVI